MGRRMRRALEGGHFGSGRCRGRAGSVGMSFRLASLWDRRMLVFGRGREEREGRRLGLQGLD